MNIVFLPMLVALLRPATAAEPGPAAEPIATVAAATAAEPTPRADHPPNGDATPLVWTRTELYFGMSRAGRPIGRAAWRRFVDTDLVAAFPDGFTTWEATGTWRGAGGVVHEGTRVVMVVWDPGLGDAAPGSAGAVPTATTDAAIERVRAAWVRTQHQESVLRVDTPAEVGFWQ
jgi:hypothetical protein